MTTPFVPLAVKAGNAQETAIQTILKQGAALASTATTALQNIKTTAFTASSSIGSPETSSYFLKVLFYLFLFAFSIFLILLLVHYTYKPIFKFFPGGKGIIPIPGFSDDKVYWNLKKQPLPETKAPALTDTELAAYPFINNFSFSIDLYLRKLINTTAQNRLILFKTYRYGQDTNVLSNISNTPPIQGTNLVEYCSSKTSMIMYLNDSNNLILTFFTGPNGIQISSKPIQNVPLGVPFRITCVVEDKTITIYLNSKQVSQIVNSSPLTLNTSNSLPSNTQHFYSAPSWANLPQRSIYLQNLHIWPRSLTYPEVVEASPALARKEDFDLPKEELNQQCSN